MNSLFIYHFYNPPLIDEFGFKGLTPASVAVLQGIYTSEETQNTDVTNFLQFFSMPESIRDLRAPNIRCIFGKV